MEIVKYLLEKGANPDQKALCGATAMHFAAECGNLDIVKELLKHGAKMTRNEHGNLAIYIVNICKFVHNSYVIDVIRTFCETK